MNEAAFEDEMGCTDCDLTGTYDHNVDEKGRLNFPAKLREQLGATFWIARSFTDKCLAVYSAENWKNLMRQIKDIPGVKGDKVRRWICSGAAEVTPDKQGRILIPQALRRYAELEKDVVVAGTGRKAEIWNSQLWLENNMELDDETLDVLDNVLL